MRGAKTAWFLIWIAWPTLAGTGGFSGLQALEFTERVVAFGPRPPGSQALERLREWIVTHLRQWGWRVELDRFPAHTPRGVRTMVNILAHRAGETPSSVVISGHYDTKELPGIHFVGANDGGSSTGFLLEMARTLAAMPVRKSVWLVWFDGEEALEEWSEEDGLYGSRHLASRWQRQGVLRQVEALINVDMIGDRELGIAKERYSDPELVELIWRTARELGYGPYFLQSTMAVLDDHIPFVRKGVRAVDLIDFDYGPGNRWWHTEQDTPDKLSARSFQVVGDVLLAVLERLGVFR